MSGIGAERFSTLRKRFLLWAKLDLPSLIHGENEIEASDRARSMRDDNNNSIACSNAENRARQCFIAFGIEI